MKELIAELEKYFSIEEFVDETVFNKYGTRAWRFFDPRLLETILMIRVALDKSITINNWKWNGRFSQRGLRTNISSLVQNKSLKNRLYLSAHLRGAAIDFDVKGMTSVEVRTWLVENEDMLPYKIRLENLMNGKPIGWIHLDCDDEEKNPKVYLFNV